ncbi:PAS domain-containing sensor histidine kinase [Rhizobiaceae bacterium]|nr:PAS domain-containing sensor histidine kinase [Rhizobiaceae bacterium]
MSVAAADISALSSPTAATPPTASKYGGVSGRHRVARRYAIPFVIFVLLFGGASFLALLGLTPFEVDRNLILVILAINAVFTLALIIMVGREVASLLRARRKGRAAARMHIRIVGLFGIVAAAPAILVAIIAGISLDQGLERIFDNRSRTIVDNSISVAQSYVEEATSVLNGNTVNMGLFLNRNESLYNLDRTGFQNLLSGQARARGLLGAYMVRGDGTRMAGVKQDAAGSLPLPPTTLLADAADGRPSCIQPQTRNLAACAFRMRAFGENVFLYTLQAVDPTVLNSIQLMREITGEYAALEKGRVALQLAFAALYVGLCLTILLSAIWMGIAVADRLVDPIRRLIVASDQVAAGDLTVVVPASRSEGELRSLTTTFNGMIEELRTQRDEILHGQEVIDQRRRFTEAVLSGVTASVLGVDSAGTVTIANTSAQTMFGDEKLSERPLKSFAPELAAVLDRADRSGKQEMREQIVLSRNGQGRTLNVQVTVGDADSDTHSHVITIDDITDLVTAQRTSAWADVARRIAHEIKNPLTPIQLSAERIRRRYGKVITEDREVFDQCTDTIIRQVADIGRMVDEFSAFARMPKPQMVVGDLEEPLKEALFLLRVSNPDIEFANEVVEGALPARFDPRLLGQVFGNLIKNATEAMEDVEFSEGRGPRIRIRAKTNRGRHTIDIIDNGRGLPVENRARLLEPYMTTRTKGTGLGLAIVSKIVEEHGGTLELHDAPAVAKGGRGAMVRVRIPALDAAELAAAVTADETAAPPASEAIDEPTADLTALQEH